MTRLRLVLFKDRSCGLYQVRVYAGGCLAGQPTAFVVRGGVLVWLVPGESVAYVEA